MKKSHYPESLQDHLREILIECCTEMNRYCALEECERYDDFYIIPDEITDKYIQQVLSLLTQVRISRVTH